MVPLMLSVFLGIAGISFFYGGIMDIRNMNGSIMMALIIPRTTIVTMLPMELSL